MKLVTFELNYPFGKTQRVGVLKDKEVVDLIQAYALYLREEKSTSRYLDLAKAVIGENMLQFIQGGSCSFEAAQISLEYLSKKASSESSNN